MKKYLKILIQVPTSGACFKEVYRNSIQVDSSVSVNYATLLAAFDILYPQSNKIVSFTIS